MEYTIEFETKFDPITNILSGKSKAFNETKNKTINGKDMDRVYVDYWTGNITGFRICDATSKLISLVTG